jgi:hypothetical protein
LLIDYAGSGNATSFFPIDSPDKSARRIPVTQSGSAIPSFSTTGVAATRFAKTR